MEGIRQFRQPIKRHGGKTYLADWIVSLMPARVKKPNGPAADDPGWMHYVEPYFGGGAVLFTMDPEGISEVVNDIDGVLTNFWRALQSPALFEDFRRLIEAVPCSEWEYTNAAAQLASDYQRPSVRAAAAFFVHNRQSRQALGKDFATIARNRTRRGMNELPSAWLSAIEGLPEVHARLKRVVILQGDALAVIRQQDGQRTLFYLDPPYLHETRTVTDAYEHEMTLDQHVALLDLLGKVKGRFLLSGYKHPIYLDRQATYGWKRHEKVIDNKAGGGKEKRRMTECVWTNF